MHAKKMALYNILYIFNCITDSRPTISYSLKEEDAERQYFLCRTAWCPPHLQHSEGMDHKCTLTRLHFNNRRAITEGVVLVKHDKYTTSSRSASFHIVISGIYPFVFCFLAKLAASVTGSGKHHKINNKKKHKKLSIWVAGLHSWQLTAPMSR